MARYIELDALVAEIERLFEKAGNSLGEYRNGAEHTLISIKDFLNTLEVKEVDLEKEIEEYAYSLPHGTTGSSSYVSDKRLPIARQFGIKHNWDYEKVENIAEHFFDLGMAVSNKAQKGEEV